MQPQILQNIACIELNCDQSERRILFSKDIIRGKKIRSLFIFAGSEEQAIKNPYRDELITSNSVLASASLFLNLVDDKGHPFVENLSFNQFMVTTEYLAIFDLNINRVLNLDQCFISVKANELAEPIKLLMYVTYETHTPDSVKDEIHGSVTLQLPITEAYQDIKLSDFMGFRLKNKHIRKITQNGSNPFYLDMICTDGKRIENLPFTILNNFDPNEFYFDGVKIDYEHSYIRVRQYPALDGTTDITFIY
jgi:hypothetical protein